MKKIVVVALILSFLILCLAFGGLIFLLLYVKSREQEAVLRANIIKLKETIQQLEQKSNNKSLGFASAGHDICNAILVIIGLIDLCRDDVPQPQLENNLIQMRDCASKLLEILKSILDVSKVEAGKMQLEEVEFDMAQVLEESVDLCHVMALKKDLEVIWDPCDFSLWRSSKVKGDRRRLKQILDNLLGNAVKFTSEGHVVLRVSCQKPNLENLKVPSGRCLHVDNFLGPLSRCLTREKVDNRDADTPHPIHLDPSFVEFVFEVDDTGIGIPKEKRTSAFENYIQIKESNNRGHEGTGLGLGIVKSYVQLMGGEIKIKDKEPGDRGTCFKFNIFLRTDEIDGAEAAKDPMVVWRDHKVEGFHTLLLIKGDETRRILSSWMESLGIKVWIVHNQELLHHTLGDIKCSHNSSQAPDATLDDFSFDIGTSTAKDVSEKARTRGSFTYILILVDISYGVFSDLRTILDSFSEGIPNIQYKIIWLVNANTPSGDLRRLRHAPSDLVLQKPIHGSRLFKILRNIQELRRDEDYKLKIGTNRESSSTDNIKVPSSISDTKVHSSHQRYDHQKPLMNLKILLVEDNIVLQRINSVKLSRAGATVTIAGNGKEAIDCVKRALQEAIHAQVESSEAPSIAQHFQFNIILMDCEMPIMNGYDATRNIRVELNRYDIHIPIIAYTAHSTLEEEQKATLAGMDFHFTKETNPSELIKAYNRFVTSEKV